MGTGNSKVDCQMFLLKWFKIMNHYEHTVLTRHSESREIIYITAKTWEKKYKFYYLAQVPWWDQIVLMMPLHLLRTVFAHEQPQKKI